MISIDRVTIVCRISSQGIHNNTVSPLAQTTHPAFDVVIQIPSKIHTSTPLLLWIFQATRWGIMRLRKRHPANKLHSGVRAVGALERNGSPKKRPYFRRRSFHPRPWSMGKLPRVVSIGGHRHQNARDLPCADPRPDPRRGTTRITPPAHHARRARRESHRSTNPGCRHSRGSSRRRLLRTRHPTRRAHPEAWIRFTKALGQCRQPRIRLRRRRLPLRAALGYRLRLRAVRSITRPDDTGRSHFSPRRAGTSPTPNLCPPRKNQDYHSRLRFPRLQTRATTRSRVAPAASTSTWRQDVRLHPHAAATAEDRPRPIRAHRHRKHYNLQHHRVRGPRRRSPSPMS